MFMDLKGLISDPRWTPKKLAIQVVGIWMQDAQNLDYLVFGIRMVKVTWLGREREDNVWILV